MLKISSGITKHLCETSPYYMIEDKDLSETEWSTISHEGLKEQYKEYICPVCNSLHLKKGEAEILYAHCDGEWLKNTNSKTT